MANPFVIGALLIAGVGTLYWVSKKTAPKKKKKKKTAPSEEPTEPAPTGTTDPAVSKWYLFDDDCKWLDKEVNNEEGRQFVLDQMEAFGGLAQLGDPPGNVEANQEFARRFEIHMFEQLVAPACADAILNQGIKTPPLLAEFIDNLTLGVNVFMMELGYDMGMGVALEGAPMGPSLVDVVRGV